ARGSAWSRSRARRSSWCSPLLVALVVGKSYSTWEPGVSSETVQRVSSSPGRWCIPVGHTSRVMIPPLDPTTGLLPPGIYATTWDELAGRFGYNPRRQALLAGLWRALDVLRMVSKWLTQWLSR